MRMRGFFFLARPLFAAAAVVFSGVSVQGADVPGLTTVRIVDAGQDVDAEAFYAQDLGIFKKYGINADITLLRKGGGAAAVAAIAGGAADVGEGDIVSVANAHQRGIPIVLLAPSGIFRASAPTTEVIVAKDSPIKTGKDLEGKAIALISPEGPSRIATNLWLESAGAALDKVSFIEIPPVNMAAAVEHGTVAAAVINEPALVASTQSCCRVLANNFTSVGNTWQLNAWYSSADWVAKNPALARKFAQAIREAAIWANNPANHAKSGEILSKYTPFPPELLPKMNRATYGELLDPKTMQPLLDAALKYKALLAPVPGQTLISSAALAS
jgi:NitT/TauT family transport system substrate-binding protein